MRWGLCELTFEEFQSPPMLEDRNADKALSIRKTCGDSARGDGTKMIEIWISSVYYQLSSASHPACKGKSKGKGMNERRQLEGFSKGKGKGQGREMALLCRKLGHETLCNLSFCIRFAISRISSQVIFSLCQRTFKRTEGLPEGPLQLWGQLQVFARRAS